MSILKVIISAGISLCSVYSAFAQPATTLLPVFPGAVGFGAHTAAGSGRHLPVPETTVFRVTNLNAAGPGSFQECVHATMPRTCVFEVSGTIDLTGDTSYSGSSSINISHPYITIAGQTAPSPGVLIKGKTMAIRSHDVLIQHIRFRVGDDPAGAAPSSRDGLMIIGKKNNPARRPYNVVLDHVSISWGIDETFAAKDTSSYITLSNSIISEALFDSLHDKGPHSKGLMNSADYFTSYRNIIAHSGDRVPLDTSPTSIHIGNLVYNSFLGAQIADIRNNRLHNGKIRRNIFLGNIRLNGPDSISGSNNEFLYLVFNNPDKSQIFIENNACETYASNWPCVLDISPDSQRVTTKPVMQEGLEELALSELEGFLRANAGARPLDRDTVDQRIISDLHSRVGYIPDCVEETTCTRHAGGWPDIAENYRPLDIPPNYNQVMPSGYTALEEYLFSFYNTVEPALTADHPPETTTSSGPANAAPIAHAGKNVDIRDTDGDGFALRSLKGTGSSDPDGDPLTYQWYVNDVLEGSFAVLPRFNFAFGTNTVRLVVTDDKGASDETSVIINVR